MRLSTAALVALVSFAGSAHAIPVTWDLSATVTRTNYLPFGPIAVGDAITATMVVETSTPMIHPIPSEAAYLNVFDAFSLNIGGRTLTLGPDATDPGYVREANWLGTGDRGTFRTLQMAAMLYDGSEVYQAYLWFDFADLAAFPAAGLPLTPPSLSSATLRDLSLYSPVNGDPRNGAIFIAGGDVDAFTARSVPEPGALGLMAAGLAMAWIARRRPRVAR
jgi:hypothetical protein